MTERDRVLRPLQDAAGAIGDLDTYDSPAVLLEALRATWLAADRTLRSLLRSDTSVPDAIRMSALSPALTSTEAVITELRRRDLISIGLAGRMYELQQAVGRAEKVSPRAADADLARDVVATLSRELTPTRERDEIVDGRDARSPAFIPAHAPDAAAPSRPLFVLAGVAVLLVIVAVLVHVVGRGSRMDRGIAAFEADSAAIAENHFRAVLDGDPDNVTARLYLGRIMRAQGRTADAAEVLRDAARSAPRDATVRRELGYLFLDLDAAGAAVEQFRQAVELEPEDALNWVGVIVGLRAAGDPAAEEWLRRAPADARTLIQGQRGIE